MCIPYCSQFLHRNNLDKSVASSVLFFKYILYHILCSVGVCEITEDGDYTPGNQTVEVLRGIYHDGAKICKLCAGIQFDPNVKNQCMLWIDILEECRGQSAERFTLCDGYTSIPELTSKPIWVQDYTSWKITLGGLFTYNVPQSNRSYNIFIQFALKDNHITIPVRFDSENDIGVIECTHETDSEITPTTTLRLNVTKHQCETIYHEQMKVPKYF